MARGWGHPDQVSATGYLVFGDDGTHSYPILVDSSGRVLLGASTASIGTVIIGAGTASIGTVVLGAGTASVGKVILLAGTASVGTVVLGAGTAGVGSVTVSGTATVVRSGSCTVSGVKAADALIKSGTTKVHWMSVSDSAALNLELNDSTDNGGTDKWASIFPADCYAHYIFDPPMAFTAGVYLDVSTATCKVVLGYD